MAFESDESGELDEMLDPALALPARIAPGVQAKGDIFFQSKPGEELAFLRDVADLRIESPDLDALVEDPAGRERREAGDKLDEGRFAAAARPHHRDKLPVGDVEGHVLQSRDRALFRGLEDF